MLEGATEVIALADALRMPLARLYATSQGIQNGELLRVVSEHALRDIDAFIESYTVNMLAQQSLEPVALGSILVDTSYRLKSYAEISGAKLIVDNHSSRQLVMGNTKILQQGLELVTKTLCDFPSEEPNTKIVLRADTRHGYPRLGVYREDIELNAQDLALAKKLIGGSNVNAGLFQQLGALRIVIAEKLLLSIQLKLRSAKSNGHNGIALQLIPSTQGSLFNF